MTPEEMLARIAALEAQLHKPMRIASEAKAAARARKRQFQIDKWRRENSHRAINRYAIQH